MLSYSQKETHLSHLYSKFNKLRSDLLQFFPLNTFPFFKLNNSSYVLNCRDCLLPSQGLKQLYSQNKTQLSHFQATFSKLKSDSLHFFILNTLTFSKLNSSRYISNCRDCRCKYSYATQKNIHNFLISMLNNIIQRATSFIFLP